MYHHVFFLVRDRVRHKFPFYVNADVIIEDPVIRSSAHFCKAVVEPTRARLTPSRSPTATSRLYPLCKMDSNPRILTLHGLGLKLNTRADLEPHLQRVDPEALEEIHFGGNTIGVEAAQALGEFLQKTQKLKVRLIHLVMF